MANYRKIYKDYYGIDFSSDYVVHHIDMNRENNDISNLLLLPKELHAKYHGLLNCSKGMRSDKDGKKTSIRVDFAISSTSMTGYYVSDLSKLMDVVWECAKWADYKLYLDGKQPNVHGIELR